MKVKKLIELLEQEDPEKIVLIATCINGMAIVDDIEELCENGAAIQLIGESLIDDSE